MSTVIEIPILQFGKHKGKPLDEVPAGYLLWLADSDATKATLALCRYVRDHRGELEKTAAVEKEEFLSKREKKVEKKGGDADLWD